MAAPHLGVPGNDLDDAALLGLGVEAVVEDFADGLVGGAALSSGNWLRGDGVKVAGLELGLGNDVAVEGDDGVGRVAENGLEAIDICFRNLLALAV